MDAVDDRLPAIEVWLGSIEAEMVAYLPVEPLQMVRDRNAIDGVDIERGDDPAVAQIAEQRDLLAGGRRDRTLAATQQDVGLDAEAEKFLCRMLGRFGLQLSCGGDPRHQGQMNEKNALAPELVAELADRFEEGEALDVAHRPADLAEDKILALEIGLDELLDRVGDVGDDLYRRAEVFAAPFAGDHRRVDPPGGDRIAAPRGDADKALVVAEIKIGFGPIVGDEHLDVLVGAHRARIDIQIGVELAQPDPKSARLQQRSERRSRQTLAERGNHAAGDKDEPRHGISVYSIGRPPPKEMPDVTRPGAGRPEPLAARERQSRIAGSARERRGGRRRLRGCCWRRLCGRRW